MDKPTRIESKPNATRVAAGAKPAGTTIQSGTMPLGSIEQEPAPGSGRWRWLVAGSALALLALSVPAILLITRHTSIVDQLLITTQPSGADVVFDSEDLGPSPIKLEGVRIGKHLVSINKEGYEPVVDKEVQVFGDAQNAQTVPIKLSMAQPTETIGMPREQLIAFLEKSAAEAFDRGAYVAPWDKSALYYTEQLRERDETNSYAADLSERIRKAVHQSAQEAIARGDLRQAQELSSILREHYAQEADMPRLENQLGARRVEVRDLLRRAREALSTGNLADSAVQNALYFTKQALTLDKQNAEATAFRNEIKQKLIDASQAAAAGGDYPGAWAQINRAASLFPEDKKLIASAREIKESWNADLARANDPETRRLRGLQSYRDEDFDGAISDLEYAVANGKRGSAVLFALGRSYLMRGNLDKAFVFLNEVPRSSEEEYRSALGALGDIAQSRGEIRTAIEKYTEAKELGGSSLYTVSKLDDKLENLQAKMRPKPAELTAFSIPVKHMHGGLLHGSCSGQLTVSSNGIRYDGSEHSFSFSLTGFTFKVKGSEMTLSVLGKPETFRAVKAEPIEAFRQAVSRFQARSSSVGEMNVRPDPAKVVVSGSRTAEINDPHTRAGN